MSSKRVSLGIGWSTSHLLKLHFMRLVGFEGSVYFVFSEERDFLLHKDIKFCFGDFLVIIKGFSSDSLLTSSLNFILFRFFRDELWSLLFHYFIYCWISSE